MTYTTYISSTKSEDFTRYAGLLSNKYFQLIILPTEKCNFRCTYCYEDFAVGRMSKETIQGIKSLLEKRCANNLDYLKISWFGGEPLTAKDTVLEISDYAKALSKKFPNLHYTGTMTTNGYLLDYKTASILADVGVKSYQISIDGPCDVHNESRIRADGSGTYERIWANLIAIRDSSLPISVLLRIHFTVETLHLFSPLIEDLRKEFINDLRFSIFFKAIEHLGGPNDSSFQVFSELEKKEAIQSLQNKLFGENIASTQNHSMMDDYVCYAAQPNSLVLRSNVSVQGVSDVTGDRCARLGGAGYGLPRLGISNP